MIQLKFAIYDSKAEAHLPDFASPTVGTAIRLFEEGCLQEGTPFQQHPGDYTLMEIGTYDIITGINTDTVPHVDHGTARMHLSRALLERDFAEQKRSTEVHNAFVEKFRPPDDGRTTENSRKTKDLIYGKTITNGDALRAVKTKETTPS